MSEASLNETKQKILTEINRLGDGTLVLWKVFFLCMTPGILNGLHVSSYVFLGQVPENLTCIIPALRDGTTWNYDQIKNISTRYTTNNKCDILNWNYTELRQMSFDDAWLYTSNVNPKPNEISCLSKSDNIFEYNNDGHSIVAEWDLVCEYEVLRTTVQVALAIGKFIGAFLFGIVADKYGRKTSVTISSFLYIVSGPVAAFANQYWLFVLARIGLGIAGSGVYHSSYTILTEFAAPKYRSTLSIFFSVSYPLGMVILALAAYLVHPWRYLQLTLSVPAILLLIHYFFLFESPRWLLRKGKINKAHKIIFHQPIPQQDREYLEILKEKKESQMNNIKQTSIASSMLNSLKKCMAELHGLYGQSSLRGRLLICHFTFFICSLTYYVIALNGDNFLANQYIYVAVTGLAEVPSYIVPCIMFRWFGRKKVSLILFLIAGVALLAILLISRDQANLIIGIALFGRTCVSAVFAVVILHTAELFPTELRSSAIGTSSTMAHIGSISAPYIADLLGSLAWFIPTTICGAAAILAGLLVLALPETEHVNFDDEENE